MPNIRTETDLDKAELIFDMLVGKPLPEDVHLFSQPELTKDQAWSIIYFLQEIAGVLPDTIDRCDYCGDLYNADETSPGYIDDTDDWFWKETEFSEEEIRSVAHKHFDSWGCMAKAIQRAQET